MPGTIEKLSPRTTTDLVFDHLHAQIQSLELLPGTRISESEVAAQLGVSRQPVRDAFNRLGNLKLLKVRPQRATLVSGFSLPEIQNSRFVRKAVEVEVLREACRVWDESCTTALAGNLDQQRHAIQANQIDVFHSLDLEFHGLVCQLSGNPLAFETIRSSKQQVERLCVLSLSKTDEVTAILADHEAIAEALNAKDEARAEAALRRHLGRLDDTVQSIHAQHSEYFE